MCVCFQRLISIVKIFLLWRTLSERTTKNNTSNTDQMSNRYPRLRLIPVLRGTATTDYDDDDAEHKLKLDISISAALSMSPSTSLTHYSIETQRVTHPDYFTHDIPSYSSDGDEDDEDNCDQQLEEMILTASRRGGNRMMIGK